MFFTKEKNYDELIKEIKTSLTDDKKRMLYT